MEGNTMLHLLLKRQDYKSANDLLLYLTQFKLDHHSRHISELFPQLVKHELPNVSKYLESRVMTTNQTQLISFGNLKAPKIGLITSKYTLKTEKVEN
jgi:hypothetical protein